MKLRPLQLLSGGVAVAAAVVMAVRYLEDDLLFWPIRRFSVTPRDFDLEFEDVTLEPVPGIHIRGWFVPHPQPRAAALYLEGNGGNRSYRLGWVEILHDLGCSVLIMDYEGYGDSDGKPSELVVYRDARAARDWLASDERTRDLRLVLYGESLGGGVATQLAREQAPAALIISHSFTNMPEMIDLVCRGVPMSRVCRSRFNSIENIKHYHGPLLIFHGDQDRFIPFEHAKRMFAEANEPKTFIPIPGATHDIEDLLHKGAEIYRAGIKEVLDTWLARKGSYSDGSMVED